MQVRTKRMILAAATAAISTVSFWQFKAGAATFTWNGGGADDSIGTGANWIGGVAPGTAGADDWVFTGNVRTTPQNDYGPPRFALGFTSVFNIFFDSNAAAFTLGGSTITMGNTNPAGGNITNNSAFTQTFNAAVSPRTGTIAANTADIVFNGSFSAGNTANNQGGRGSTIAGAHNVFFNGPIFNGGFLVINGPGTTFLNSDNTAASAAGVAWAGTVAINGGNLVISNSNALGGAGGNEVASTTFKNATTVSGGANTGYLGLSNNINVTTENVIVQGRSGIDTEINNVSGNNTLSTAILTTGGNNYNFGSDAGKLTIGSINMNTGTTVNNQTVTPTGVRTFNLTGAGNGEIDGVNIDTSQTTVGLTKSGTGAWTLQPGVAPFLLGSATISAGTLVIQPNSGTTTTSAGALGNTPGTVLTVAAGGTLDVSAFTNYSLQAGNGTTPGQKLVGGGTVKVGGTLTRFGDNTIAPGTEGGAGTLTILGNLSLNNIGAIAGNGLKYDLADTTTLGGGVNDLINVSGDLSLDSSSGQIPVLINPTVGGKLTSGTYTLITYGGNLAGSAADLTLSGASSGTTRQTFTLDTSTAHQVNLMVSGLPANLTWVGDGSGNSWDVTTSPNWTSTATTGNPNQFYQFDVVNFQDNTTNTTVNVNGSVIPGAINVNTAQTYLVQGSGTITGGAALNKSGTGTFILANTGSNDFSGAITINSGTIQIGNGGADGSIGAGAITNNGALVVNKSSATTLSNAISGTGALVVNGTGGLLLNTNNTYTGPTIVNAGRLQVASANALGDSTGGTTVSGTGAEVAVFNALTINEPLTINGTGLDATGGALHAGGSVVSTWAGPITLGSDSTIKVDGSNAGLIVTNTVTGTNSNLTLAADSGGTGTVSNAISLGSGALIKSGAGTWVLGGTNTYTGGTRIDAGVLAPITLAAIPGAINLNGGTFRYPAGDTTDLSPRIALLGAGGGIDTNGNAITFASPIGTGATGGLTKTGGGTLTLSAANSYTGATNINGGVLQANDGVGIPAASNLTFSGGTLETTANINRAVGTGAGQIQLTGPTGITANGADVAVTLTNGGSPISFGSATFNPNTINFNKAGSTNTLTFNADLSMDAAGTFIANGGTVVMNTAFSSTGGLNFNGSGLFVINGSGSYSGSVTINPGTQALVAVRAVSSNALGTGTVTTGAGGNATQAVLQLAGDGITLPNPINMTGRANLAPDLENISGNNTFSGPIRFNTGGGSFNIQSDAGTLNITGADSGANGVAISSQAGGTRNLTLQGVGNGNVSGQITNGNAATVTVTKAGAGLWVLSGSTSYVGITTVKNGTLELGVNAQGPVLTTTAASGGGADVQGGRLTFDYTGSTIAPTIKGLLTTSFADNGFKSTTEQIRSTTATGTLGLGMTDDGAGKVTVGYTVFGDANLDNKVNALDFNAISTNYGTGTYWYQGDFNYDGTVNTADFLVLSQNFGGVTPTPTAAPVLAAPLLGSVVPEPATLGLIFGVAALLTTRRRRATTKDVLSS